LEIKLFDTVDARCKHEVYISLLFIYIVISSHPKGV